MRKKILVSAIIILSFFTSAKSQDTLLSAFFGLDNGLPSLLCNQLGSLLDGMPVNFKFPVDASSLSETDFEVLDSLGNIHTPICAFLAPANENRENTPLPTLGGQTIYDLTLSSLESNKTFVINGKFRHTISGCNNTNNPEINCVEFIHFYNETEADILIGGSDIVNLANYEVIDNRIDIEITHGLNINISFIIQDEMTLRRIESDDIWNKVE